MIPHELQLMNEETNPKIQARMAAEQIQILCLSVRLGYQHVHESFLVIISFTNF